MHRGRTLVAAQEEVGLSPTNCHGGTSARQFDHQPPKFVYLGAMSALHSLSHKIRYEDRWKNESFLIHALFVLQAGSESSKILVCL